MQIFHCFTAGIKFFKVMLLFYFWTGFSIWISRRIVYYFLQLGPSFSNDEAQSLCSKLATVDDYHQFFHVIYFLLVGKAVSQNLKTQKTYIIQAAVECLLF